MVEGDKQENKFPEGKLERLAEQNHQNGSWRTNYIFVERLTDTASDIWGLANYHLSENTTVKKKKKKLVLSISSPFTNMYSDMLSLKKCFSLM